MNKKKFGTFLIASFFSFTAIAQQKAEKEVAAAVETMRKAMVDADSSALNKIAAEQLTYGHSGGKLEKKADFIRSIMSGQSDFVTLDLTDQTIQVSGKTAIVRHTLSAQTNDNGKPGTVKLLIMLVWQKQHKHWKLIARQAVKYPVS